MRIRRPAGRRRATVAAGLAILLAAVGAAGCGEPESVVRARQVNAIIAGLRGKEDDAAALDDGAARLAALGADALDRLVRLLAAPDAGTRQLAAALAGRVAHAPALESLVALLQDDADPNVRAEAAQALGRLQDVRALAPLLATLAKDQPSTTVLKAVSEAIDALRTTHGLDALLAAARDPDPGVRRGAAAALAAVQDGRAAEALLGALEDENVKVRAQAARSLGATREDRAFAALAEALKAPIPEVRQAAAEGLAALGDPRAVAPLMEALRDKDRMVVRRAVDALIAIGKPAVPALIGALKDKDPQHKLKAVYALGQIRDYRAIEPLMALLTDSQKHVVNWAADALVKITGYQREGVPEYWRQWWAANKQRFQEPEGGS